jgi:signal transduction histidine kinase
VENLEKLLNLVMKKIYLSLFLLVTGFFFGQSKTIDSLKFVIKNSVNDTIKINTLCKLSFELANYNLVECKKNAFKALKIAQKIKNNRLIANSYHRIGSAYFYSGILDSALIFNNKALKLRQILNLKRDLGASYSNLGNLHTELTNYKEALTYHQKTIEVDMFYKDKYSLGGSIGDMGITYQKMGDFDNSIKCYLKSLKIAQELKDERGVCFNYINLGILYHLSDNKIEAINSYNKSLFLAKKLNIKSVEARILNSVGQLYLELSNKENKDIDPKTNQFEKAKKALFKALEIAKNISDESEIANSYAAIGNYYLKQIKNGKLNDKTFELSKKYLDSNLVIITKIKNELQVPVSLSSIGDLYLAKKDFRNAEKYELQALIAANKAGTFDTKITVLEHLYTIYKSMGKPDLAFKYYVDFTKLKDSMYGVKTQTSIVTQKMNFEFEKKSIKDSIANANQKFIASAKLSKEKNQKIAFGSLALLALVGVGFTYFLYRQKQKTNSQLTEINDKINRQNNTLKTLNTELITSEENLQKSNNSKEQLISMMSHDLLNPITAITNYNQQIISRKNNSDELLQAFKTVDAAIQPMHGLLDNMLHWTAIQKDGISSKLKNQDINDIVKEIIGIYRPQAQLKFIKLNDVLDSNFISETDKSILSLILRNLLNNAIKYSGNETIIEISSNTETKTISIKDQGFGMTDEMINYLNKKQLDKIEAKGTGLGLKLCYEFADAINAEIVFEKNENGGVRVDLKLAS